MKKLIGKILDKIFKRITDRLDQLQTSITSITSIHAKSKLQCFLLSSQGKPRIYHIISPTHGNLGDHAIAMADIKICKELIPNASILDISISEYWYILEELLIVVQPEDLFVTIGGGNFGNLYHVEEDIRNSIVYHFPNNKIISMGQSVTFLDNGDNALETSQKIYKQHKKFHIVGRDELSFERIKEYFPTNKHYLCPDSVLFLEEDYQNISPRELDVLFTLRNDKEKVRSDDLLSSIENYIQQNHLGSDHIDTAVEIDVKLVDRQQIVEDLLKKIASSKVNITDRYHGVIFSVITGTPVIALKSFDHKIPEGMKWFKHLDWVHYVENGDDIIPLVQKYLDPNYKVEHKFIFKELILNTYKNME